MQRQWIHKMQIPQETLFADARGGGGIHIDGQHTVTEGDEGDEGRGHGEEAPGDGSLQPLPAAAAATAAHQEAESENYTPQSWTAAELAQGDPHLQVLSPADRMLISMYGDTIHQNDGRHLDGGIGGVADQLWQRLH